MLYISGMQALNLPCNLDTSGDWHRSCMDWSHLTLKENNGSIWGEYGIEGPKVIPDNKEKHYVANHIRALLDMLCDRNFSDAQGMNDDYIGSDKYDEEIFRQVTKMKDLPYWADIDSFMEKNICYGGFSIRQHTVLMQLLAKQRWLIRSNETVTNLRYSSRAALSKRSMRCTKPCFLISCMSLIKKRTHSF